MLTIEQFEGLAVGDVVEAVPFFPNLSPDPVRLRVAEKSHDRAAFVVVYHGVTLGRWSVNRSMKGGLSWTLS